MRTLVVSDIHGNYHALKQVVESQSFDHVLCLGDLVDYGPQPKECIDWVRRYSHTTVRGNHDQAVGARVSCQCSEAFLPLSIATRELTWRLLPPEDLKFLATHPLQIGIELGGVRLWLVHATPSDPLYAYLRADTVERWETETEKLDADIVLTGHTHYPMNIRAGLRRVVNPGSVGQPRDGDPRASFAIIEDGIPRLCRLEYDVAATVSELQKTDLPGEVVTALSGILWHGGRRE